MDPSFYFAAYYGVGLVFIVSMRLAGDKRVHEDFLAWWIDLWGSFGAVLIWPWVVYVTFRN